MTDQRNSLFYSYSLFPFQATELFPEQSPLGIDGKDPSKQHRETPGWDAVAHETNRQLLCPRCSSCVPESINWCSTCGELLIGARVCSTDFSEWNSNGQSFFPTHVSRNPTSTPEWYSTNALHPRTSHTYQEARSRLREYAMPAVALNPIVDATSLASASSFNPPFFCTSAVQSEEFPISVAHQSNPAYHVAETSVPGCSPQLESLRSCFGELHLNSTGPSSYACGNGYNRPASIFSAYTDPLAGITSSYSDCSKDGSIIQPMGRQRCVSGPVQRCALTAERGHFSEVLHLDCFPVCQRLDTRISPFEFHGSDLRQQSPGLAYAHPCGYSVQFPSSVPQSIADVRSLRHLATHLNRSRHKHPSECSASQLCSSPARPYNAGALGIEPRSRSSDVHVLNRENLNNEGTSLACSWGSSRLAWSAHSPQLQKKYGCFTGTSNQRSNRELRDNRLRSYADIHHRANTSTASPLSHPGSGQQSSTDSRPRKPTAESVLFPRVRSERHSCRYRGDAEKWKKKSRRGVAKRRTSASQTVAANVAIDVDRVSTSCASNNQIDSTIHSTENTVDPVELASATFPDWMQLPNELWIAILRFLLPRDRAQVARVCRRLSGVVGDPSLWHVVQLRRRQHLSNSSLVSISRLRPKDLRFSYCHGQGIDEAGLHQLFKSCGSSLRKLSFVGCTKGLFDTDLTLLLAAQYCPNLAEVDASYTVAVSDRTVVALAKSTRHLVSLKLNGAQQISNSAIQQLVRYHKGTLQRLELFGCFRLNSDIFTVLSHCQQLRALAFGHLHHLSSDGLLELVGKLPLLASLDLRGTQTLANDTNLSHLADKCPHLEEVVLANMLSVKQEAGVVQMLRRLPRLRVLDLCGLVAVGDLTMEALATGCPQLEELDVSCTSVTHTGLSHLTKAPAKCLRCLRISHCREITKEVLEKLVEACTKLTLIHAYGFKAMTDWSFLQKIRPSLHVVCDG